MRPGLHELASEMPASTSIFHDVAEGQFAGGNATTVDLLESAEGLAALLTSAEVSRLKRRPGNGFQHDGFLRSSLESAADRVVVGVARRGDAIATVWPLRLVQRYGIRLATDLVSPFAQYSDVLGEPFDRDGFRIACDRLRDGFGVDAILCRGVRRDSALAEVLPESGIVEKLAAPFVDLAAFATFENYCTRFSKQTARTRRQRRRKLESQHGPIDFNVLDGRQGREAIARALQWKREWLDTNGLSSRIVHAGDLQNTLLAAIDDPATHVSVLSAQGRPIAVELGFSCAGNYAAFMGAYDPAFAAFSPGQEQMLLTIEWCFTRRFARYDLLPPRDAYKLHWTRPHDEEMVSDYCVPLSAAGAIYSLARRYARTPAKRTVLSLPAELRVAARRYGPVAAGIGATALTIGVLAD